MSHPPHHPFRSREARDRFLARYEERAARWPLPCEERFVDTSLGKTFVRVSGPEGAPALVLLHGVWGSSLQWEPNIRDLARERRVYAVDGILDCGKSVYTRLPKDGKEIATWVGDVLDGLGLEKGVHLGGLSFGGWISCMYAVHAPKRLRSLVLIAPAFTVLPVSREWMARAMSCLLPLRWFTASFMYWMLADTARQGDKGRQTVEEWIDDSRAAVNSFARKPILMPTVLSDEELANLSVPTLFMVGENEKIYPAKDAIARLRRVAPKVETELVAAAGHDLTLAQARKVDAKILEFTGRFSG